VLDVFDDPNDLFPLRRRRAAEHPAHLQAIGENEMTATVERIQNRCPACGSQSLFIGAGGWLTCGVIGCRNPSPEGAFEQWRLDIIRASQLQHEVEEARREALAMRRERDIEISKRVVLQATLARPAAGGRAGCAGNRRRRLSARR
jgi:hypothetical protein